MFRCRHRLRRRVQPGAGVAVGGTHLYPSPNPDVIAYRLYFGTQSGFYDNSITYSDVSDVILPGLAGGQTYYFAVSAINANGEESELSNEAWYSVPAADALTLQAQAPASAALAVDLSWTPSPESDVFGYAVYYGTQSGVYDNSATFYYATNGIISALTGGMTYYFAVSAMDSYGVSSVLSNEAIYSVPMSPPMVLQTQMFTDDYGQPYLLRINTQSPVSGSWEMDYSTDLQNWYPYTYGYGYGNADGYDVDVYAWMDPAQPLMFFRVFNY